MRTHMEETLTMNTHIEETQTIRTYKEETLTMRTHWEDTLTMRTVQRGNTINEDTHGGHTGGCIIENTWRLVERTRGGRGKVIEGCGTMSTE